MIREKKVLSQNIDFSSNVFLESFIETIDFKKFYLILDKNNFQIGSEESSLNLDDSFSNMVQVKPLGSFFPHLNCLKRSSLNCQVPTI